MNVEFRFAAGKCTIPKRIVDNVSLVVYYYKSGRRAQARQEEEVVGATNQAVADDYGPAAGTCSCPLTR